MHWVLSLRHAALTPLFLGLSWLGDRTFFLVFLASGYWLGDRRLFARLTMILLLSGLLNSTLKQLFALPRPQLQPLAAAAGWSFPSGHAQVTAAVFGFLALERRRPWLRWLAAFLVAGVAASRVYLGVHDLADVSAGVLIGLATAVAGWRWLHRSAGRPAPLPAPASAGLCLAAVAWSGILAHAGDPEAAAGGGALLGFVGGYARQRSAWPRAGAAPRLGIAGTALGLGAAFALRLGLASALAALSLDPRWTDFLRFGALGAWVSWWAPWLCHALGLTRASPDAPEAPGAPGPGGLSDER